MNKKIAILGASYLQRPLVLECKSMQIETHVFAWNRGNVIMDICDYFYDISITDKEAILKKCTEINIDGIISIASDIAMPTVNYIANKLNLTGNDNECTIKTTNKYEMRKALRYSGISCPNFEIVTNSDFEFSKLKFPLIIKPVDSSGSRGIQKINDKKSLESSIRIALSHSRIGKVIVEEFFEGNEYSIEAISYKGRHSIIAITEKTTTKSPYFMEIAHHQPANISKEQKIKIAELISRTLNALGIINGASHTEILIKDDNMIIVESAGRMGGDWIGSHITSSTSGFNFVQASILVSLGQNFEKFNLKRPKHKFSGIYYVLAKPGRIREIKVDLSKKPTEIKDYKILLEEGDLIPTTLNEPGGRAAIVFYESEKRITYSAATDFIQFITTN